MDQPPPSAPPAPPTTAACCHCGAPDLALDWHDKFQITVCSACFKKHERLISKSNAKSAYLLSDSDLFLLGFVEKPNPRNQKFANMKQYLLSQVEALAASKHSSLEELEAEKQRRMQGKLEQRINKRQAAEQEEERQRRHEARLQATLDKYSNAAVASPSGGGRQGGDGAPPAATGKRKKPLSSEDLAADVEVEEF